ncbi:MAG: hypothetical protein KF911_13000 [Pseudomonadales bacterium]|nr:hypothetical protein [Pseudomonadales bacterium]
MFQASSTFAARCVAPRSGIDPGTGQAYPDRAGSRLDQNNWLRSWSNELYLWYNEIVDRNPANYETPAYFDLLRTEALTPSGRPKDNFHFSLSTAEWQALSQSGVSAGYGITWSFLSVVPPRDIRVAFVQPGSPAAGSVAAVTRGERLVGIDGINVVSNNTASGVDTINAGLFPEAAGEVHQLSLEDPATGSRRSVTITSELVTADPVPAVHTLDTGSGVIGYMLFNEHIATAETALIDAIQLLQSAAIDDLVIDIRYNGGGFLAIASQLAYMIAGPARSSGRTFERLQFNDKHRVRNPVTGELLEPIPFIDTSIGLSSPGGAPLPTLDLDRVFLLTGADTCSASESIINSLRGIDFPVIQIGSTTCGKPYGFYPTDNCGTTYFTIQFTGVNDQGFGEFPDGFSPANTPSAPGVPVTGCAVADDFGRALGDPAEARFAAALGWRTASSCPAPSGMSVASPAIRGLELPPPAGLAPAQPPWRQARVAGF